MRQIVIFLALSTEIILIAVCSILEIILLLLQGQFSKIQNCLRNFDRGNITAFVLTICKSPYLSKFNRFSDYFR